MLPPPPPGRPVGDHARRPRIDAHDPPVARPHPHPPSPAARLMCPYSLSGFARIGRRRARLVAGSTR